VTFSHPLLAEILPVPARKPIKPVYITRAVNMVDQIRELEEDRYDTD